MARDANDACFDEMFPEPMPAVQRSLKLAAAKRNLPAGTPDSIVERVADEILDSLELWVRDPEVNRIADDFFDARFSVAQQRTRPHVAKTFFGFLCNACGLALYPPPGCSADELQCWNRLCRHYEQRFRRPRLDVPASVSIE